MPNAWAQAPTTDARGATSDADQAPVEEPSPAEGDGSRDSSTTGDAPGQGRGDGKVELPELERSVEATYPPQARAEGREGRVVLRLTIDAEGTVTDAEVVEAAGHGFDEAARRAALRFRFSPAREDGVAIASRVLFAYDFELPPPEDGSAEAGGGGSVDGRVLVTGDPGADLAGMTAVLTDAEGTEHATTTDARGRFFLEGLAPGTYILRIVDPGYERASQTVVVTAGAAAGPRVSLRRLDASEETIDVTVEGYSAAERLRRSSRAVQVVEVEQAQRQTADLGEVLARTQGVGVRRGGGLGSSTRFSLNGLTDDQIRFFLNGVPLHLAGYPFGLANVPVNLIDRVEIYSGVVPIHFGADALGGAVNLVTGDPTPGTHGSASYQAGSFGTHRVTLGLRHLDEPTGLYTSASLFLDHSDNDYTVDVDVADPRPETLGQSIPAEVHRFHDGYTAGGVSFELGVVDQSWAKQLVLRGFASRFDKELQSNLNMARPYGEVVFDDQTYGGTLRYEHVIDETVALDLVGGFSRRRQDFRDTSECIYDWYGRCVLERQQPGEITPGEPRDDSLFEDTGYARLNAGWHLHPEHILRLSVAPTHVARGGEDRIRTNPNIAAPITAERNLTDLVSGIEYQLSLFDDALENIVFVKNYVQNARSSEPVTGGAREELETGVVRFGGGDSLRYRFTDWIYAKASYEYATRLPNAGERFGDALLTNENLELEPEVSHNVNLGATVDLDDTSAGDWRLTVNGFWREIDNLIVLLPAFGERFRHENVFAARSVGVEGGIEWQSPGDYLILNGNASYIDFRNLSAEGPFELFDDDRIPNRPYFFTNGAATVQFADVFTPLDRISLLWSTRFVHEFFQFWESAGLEETKRVIEDQLLHAIALSYLVERGETAFSFTGEIQNLTDQPAFDVWGAQRPGRAAYFKTTAEF